MLRAARTALAGLRRGSSSSATTRLCTWLAALVLASLAGCASLPPMRDRPETFALPPSMQALLAHAAGAP